MRRHSNSSRLHDNVVTVTYHQGEGHKALHPQLQAPLQNLLQLSQSSADQWQLVEIVDGCRIFKHLSSQNYKAVTLVDAPSPDIVNIILSHPRKEWDVDLTENRYVLWKLLGRKATKLTPFSALQGSVI